MPTSDKERHRQANLEAGHAQLDTSSHTIIEPDRTALAKGLDKLTQEMQEKTHSEGFEFAKKLPSEPEKVFTEGYLYSTGTTQQKTLGNEETNENTNEPPAPK